MNRRDQSGDITMGKKHSAFISVLMITCLVIMVVPVSVTGDSSGDVLTRGGRFTITVTGLPSTAYYVWLTRTSTMTGKPGDQPPVIVPFQSGIQQDPPEGPYTIGSYMINNGNGHTIRDDITPSTPELSNTNYYALVTTDIQGRAVITFQTSSNTATTTFSIKVENPHSAANNDILIERGLPVRMTTTPAPEVSVIIPITTAPALILTANPSPTTIISTTMPVTTLSPAQQTPPAPGYCIMAIVTGLIAWSKREFFY